MSDTNNTQKTVTILALALLGFTLFQASQILTDRASLRKFHEQIDKATQQADKLITDSQKTLDQLNSIAIGTQRLADAGNANAKEIVQQLARLGIKINPNFKEDQQKAAATSAAANAPAPVPVPTGAAPAAPTPAPAVAPAAPAKP